MLSHFVGSLGLGLITGAVLTLSSAPGFTEPDPQLILPSGPIAQSLALPQFYSVRDINAAINIRNEGLRILDSGSGSTALGRDVGPKGGRRKSTLSEAVAVD
jgi:hypothetical protein